MARKQQLSIGSVIEFTTQKGLAYAQYSHEIHLWGSLIRILPGYFAERPSDIEWLIAQEERFYTFHALKHSVRKKYVSLVGGVPVPKSKQSFPLMRILTPPGIWRLFDGEKEWCIDKPSEGFYDLSIALITASATLVKRIEEGWQPADIKHERWPKHLDNDSGN